jgi:hypothetical protein
MRLPWTESAKVPRLRQLSIAGRDIPVTIARHHLARRYVVATQYQDWTGRHTTVVSSTLIAVLDALGVPASTRDERTAALAAHDRAHWARSLPPTIVGRSGIASSFWVHVTHGDPARLWIRLEDGSFRTGLRQLENNRAPYDLDGRSVGEATFNCPRTCRWDIPSTCRSVHPTPALWSSSPRVAGVAQRGWA